MPTSTRGPRNSSPRRRGQSTSQLICDLTPSLDIRGFRSKPWALHAPDGRRVEISSTPLHFGGVRWWLHCPDCNRRCTVLYGSSCRVCLGAVHKSSTLSPRDRLFEKALAIRKRLGQRGSSLLDPLPSKPRGMHFKTYRRLTAECQETELRFFRAEADRWGLVDADADLPDFS